MSGVEDVGASFEAPLILAKLFRHGGSQAVRLPKAFRFEGEEVTVRRDGDAVILEPVRVFRPKTEAEWEAFWAEIDANGGGEFPDCDEAGEQERDLNW